MARVDAALAKRLDAALEADLEPGRGRLGKVRRYLDGHQDLPYMPRKARNEYRHLARRSIINWLPLISDTYAQNLFVDGYRAAKASDNATPWDYWQANGLDSRQSIAHRGALEFGTSYMLVLPGTLQTRRVPVMRPLAPMRSAAWYQDEDDEFPELALLRKGTTMDGTSLVEVFDDTNVYTFARPKADRGQPRPDWILSATDEHGLGVTPFVRFRDRLDGPARGIIAPVIPLQDRINEISFATLIAIQYASFRQRWATGLSIPEDENGNPVEPFEAAVDRLWIAEDETAKFGDFAQTELSGHQNAYTAAVRDMAAISQVSPPVMMGDLANISAEALAAIQDSTQRRSAEFETLFGESWESGLRLAALAAGDSASAADTSAQVRWRDTEARSLASTVDALGKIAQMLQVPVEALWEKIPGVTDQDVQRWTELRDDAADPIAALLAETDRQTAPTSAAQSNAADVKAQADALGSLIRAGVQPDSAAQQVGLDSVEFIDGAVPVALRLPQEIAAVPDPIDPAAAQE